VVSQKVGEAALRHQAEAAASWAIVRAERIRMTRELSSRGFFLRLCNLRSGNSVGGTAKLRLLGIPYSWSSIHPGGPIALQET
jgi:hypothetical protein